MGRFKSWIMDRRIKQSIKLLREEQLKDVSRFIKKVYNPAFISSKPKYRTKLSKEEKFDVNLAVRSIYNSPKSFDKVETKNNF